MYHNPVMLHESVDGLAIKPNGTYVDVTFGGGGHSKEILSRLVDGKLLAFDQDEEAESNRLENPNLIFVAANFRYLKKYLRLNKTTAIDGLLADLGVSSHQFDSAARGFSIRFNADLDMRMDKSSSLTAAIILNTYTEEDLHRIFGMYGEVQNAKSLAREIVSARISSPIESIDQLKEILIPLAKRGKQNQYMAQVFQALRIEVNDELGALTELLLQSAEVISPGGRLAVISYHSLEDRMVKNFINKGKFRGEVEKDFFGNEIKPFAAVNRKAIIPTDAEIELNNRSRSAKLRIAVKL